LSVEIERDVGNKLIEAQACTGHSILPPARGMPDDSWIVGN
jgi:hypothetical protein